MKSRRYLIKRGVCFEEHEEGPKRGSFSKRSFWQRTRRFDLLKDRRPGAAPKADCPVCSSKDYWGRSDIDPFLDRAG